tara:strand:+ start:174 stop:290 length:117 start_codon:yes stop_codon:yes gene_type:complete
MMPFALGRLAMSCMCLLPGGIILNKSQANKCCGWLTDF